MGKAQDHRNSIEQWLAIGNWRLAVGGGWLLAVGGPWGLFLTKKNWVSQAQPWLESGLGSKVLEDARPAPSCRWHYFNQHMSGDPPPPPKPPRRALSPAGQGPRLREAERGRGGGMGSNALATANASAPCPNIGAAETRVGGRTKGGEAFCSAQTSGPPQTATQKRTRTPGPKMCVAALRPRAEAVHFAADQALDEERVGVSHSEMSKECFVARICVSVGADRVPKHEQPKQEQKSG